MSDSRRLGRWLPVLALGVFVSGAVSAPAARADAEATEAAAGNGCITDYLSRGKAVAVGPIYGIPYESVAGAPYTENELNSKPQSMSLASNAREGFVGDVVLGTSIPGAVPPNPMEAKAIWPPAAESSNGPSYRSDAKAAYGPFAQAVSKAEARRTTAVATAFGEPGSPVGPSRSFQEAGFDGTVVKGKDEVIGYNLLLGTVSIDKMHSILEYATDGTEAGTIATWKLEFSGVRGEKDKVYTVTQHGIAGQDGDPNGAEQIKQFNEGAKQFGEALEQAGIGEGKATIAPGQIELRPGYIRITAAALELREFPKSQRNRIGHQLGTVFGYHDRLVEVNLGPCVADVNQRTIGEVEQPPDKSINAGPITIPDPTPPSYGGPKSAEPVAPEPTPAVMPGLRATPPLGTDRVSRPWF